jgi:hypothetical protein
MSGPDQVVVSMSRFRIPGLLFAEAGPGHGIVEGPDDAGDADAGEGGRLARDVVGDDPAVLVGGGAQGHEQLAPGVSAVVAVDHAVAARVDVPVVGLAVFVDQNPAPFGAVDAGLAGEPVVGPGAHGDHGQIGVDRLLVGAHRGDLSVPADADDPLAEDQLHALAPQIFGREGGDVPVENARHDLIGHLDHGDIQPPMDQGFGHFDADEARAHEHRLFEPLGLDLPHQALGVSGMGHEPDVLHIHARNRRSEGRTAGGQDQLVVGQVPLLARFEVPHPNRLGRTVDGQGLGPDQHLEALGLLKEHGRPGHAHRRFDQGVDIVEQAFHIVRKTAGAVGHDAVAIDQGDFRFGHQPTQTGRGFGSGGHAAEDENAQRCAHGIFLSEQGVSFRLRRKNRSGDSPSIHRQADAGSTRSMSRRVSGSQPTISRVSPTRIFRNIWLIFSRAKALSIPVRSMALG